jgi:hypothetical protein
VHQVGDKNKFILYCTVRETSNYATTSFVVSTCQFARPHETARFPTGQTFVIVFIEFHYNNGEKIQSGLLSDANKRHFTCDLEMLLRETPLGKTSANILAQDRIIKSKGLLLRTAYISLCFICASSRQATIVSPLKWNMLRLFHRQD